MQAPQSAVLLRIYTDEGKHNGTRPVYEDIVLRARAAGLAGATVLRGPMGFGIHAVVRTAKILDIAAHLPLVIEIVDSEHKIRAFLGQLNDMRDLGLVTLEKVEVVHYGSAAHA